MRRFYIFNINKNFKSLEKNSPYHLFKMFENIFYLNEEEKNYGIAMYQKIVNPIDKNNINDDIFNTYYNDLHYSKYRDIHIYNDYFKNEETRLKISKAYIILETSSIKPEFFKKLKNNKNLFVCDFNNQDYFWLESIA